MGHRLEVLRWYKKPRRCLILCSRVCATKPPYRLAVGGFSDGCLSIVTNAFQKGVTMTDFNYRTHNGEITIRNTETGNHRTFKIRTQKQDANFRPGERILYLLIGPDNTKNYKGFAFIEPDGRISVWRKYASDSVFQKFADMVANPQKYQPRAEYLYSGACRICNRKLTNPESIKSGIGPECARRLS